MNPERDLRKRVEQAAHAGDLEAMLLAYEDLKDQEEAMPSNVEVTRRDACGASGEPKANEG